MIPKGSQQLILVVLLLCLCPWIQAVSTAPAAEDVAEDAFGSSHNLAEVKKAVPAADTDDQLQGMSDCMG